MTLRKTVLLLLLVAACAAYLLRVEIPAERAEKLRSSALPGIGQEQIERIEVKGPHGEYAFSRKSPVEGGRAAETPFQLAGSEGAVLDAMAVNRLVSTLAELKLDTAVDREQGDTLEQYGLQQPPAEIRVKYSGGERAFRLGEMNDYLRQRYISVEGSDQIFMIDNRLFEAINRKREDFREKKPIRFYDFEVKKLIVAPASSPEIVFELSAENEWRITSPLNVAADSAVIARIFQGLRDFEAKRFVSPQVMSPEFFGLDHPAVKVTLGFDGRSREDLLIAVGHSPSEDKFAFTVAGQPDIMPLSGNPLPLFPESAEAYRQRHYMRTIVENVEGAEFKVSDQVFKLSRLGSEWQLNGAAADQPFVRELLQKVSDLEAQRHVDGEGSYGFDDPALEISLAVMGRKEPLKLVVGSAVQIDKQPYRYAATGDRSEVFLITEEQLKAVTPRKEALMPTPAAAPEETPGAA